MPRSRRRFLAVVKILEYSRALDKPGSVARRAGKSESAAGTVLALFLSPASLAQRRNKAAGTNYGRRVVRHPYQEPIRDWLVASVSLARHFANQ